MPHIGVSLVKNKYQYGPGPHRREPKAEPTTCENRAFWKKVCGEWVKILNAINLTFLIGNLWWHEEFATH